MALPPPKEPAEIICPNCGPVKNYTMVLYFPVKNGQLKPAIEVSYNCDFCDIGVVEFINLEEKGE